MRNLMMAAVVAIGVSTAPAVAQNIDLSGGLVDVTIQDVTILENFLNDTQIAALNNLNVPITVQVPIGVAANVCGVNANVLAQQERAGGAECDAKSGSQALAGFVSRQLLTQEM
jgi:hypothetical protein